MKNSTLLFLFLWLGACGHSPSPDKTIVEEEVGSPDLTIFGFIPPVIMAGSAAQIYLSDYVVNAGEGPSAEVTIRYYISDKPVTDVNTVKVIGERTLRPLAAKEEDQSMEMPFIIPLGFGAPPLYLAACVDAENTSDEINEDNNCTINNGDNGSLQFNGAIYDAVGVMPSPVYPPQ